MAKAVDPEAQSTPNRKFTISEVDNDLNSSTTQLNIAHEGTEAALGVPPVVGGTGAATSSFVNENAQSDNLTTGTSTTNTTNTKKDKEANWLEKKLARKSQLSLISNSGSNSTPEHDTTENNNQYTVHYHPSIGNPIILNKAERELEEQQCRFMSKTGRYLVKHVKHKHQKSQRLVSDFFTTFVDMKWRYTLASFALFFLISWLFFAVLYYSIETIHYTSRYRRDNSTTWGGHCIGETNADNKFTGMFLFSLETQTTIGYGFRGITAQCPAAIIVLIIQSVIGCLIDAFTAGYIIAKFSRPKKRAATLLFSKEAVICQRDGRLCLMIRVGNLRKSLLVEATIRMLYVSEKKTQEEEVIPLGFLVQAMSLDLGGESEKILLVTPQIVCHPIDGESPLNRLNKKDLDYLSRDPSTKLKEKRDVENFEIIVVLEGQVESTGMTMQARVSYTPNEIKWGKTFDNILETGSTPGYKVNFSKFHQIIDPKNGTESELSAYERREELSKYESEQFQEITMGREIGDRNENNNNNYELRRRNAPDNET